MENSAVEMISSLERQNAQLQAENNQLRALLECHGIEVDITTATQQSPIETNEDFVGDENPTDIETSDSASCTSSSCSDDISSESSASTYASSFSDTTSICGNEWTFEPSTDDWTTGAESAPQEVNSNWDNSTPVAPMIQQHKQVTPADTFFEESELAKRTRLADDFDKTNAVFVRIPSTRLKHFLTKAVDHAQEVIFRSFSKLAPEEAPRNWDAPAFVSFARGDLQALPESIPFGTNTKFGDSFDADIEVVSSAIIETYDVRNAAAHLGYLTSWAVDELLTRVHRLAIVMQDEGAAVKIRKLRDQLQMEAQQGLEKIKAGWQDGTRPPKHIERTFEDCLCAKPTEWSKFPQVIREAAEAWKQMYDESHSTKRSGFIYHYTTVMDKTGNCVKWAVAALDSAQQFTQDMNDKYNRPYRVEAARQREIRW
ncbi:uncharacterized protein MYCFIDRAFT_199614 [Pseudocercospora fijiensis CIRAD86]|uniref:Uncharacterized protein n=1 Tax=Pseudocercospora fijiensis (strain CIRAD86) TaxID=383855 RepID=M3A1Y0_PSEFD|nr:uncharacterized protein MYCFIDRAFT_199614 [Pseudocercospora fijiensis CIRAD86]EME78401.1 hypothetical protein MYCFIDRAFT_199614 [Pseudocercospora fijiensis CIRAD86]